MSPSKSPGKIKKIERICLACEACPEDRAYKRVQGGGYIHMSCATW
jgi:hypothetical protein